MTEQTGKTQGERETPATEAPSISPEEGTAAVAEGAQEEVARPAPAEPVDVAGAAPAGANLAPSRPGGGRQGAGNAGTSPAEADAAARSGEALTERPEVQVAGAFAGGLLLAIVLRALGRG